MENKYDIVYPNTIVEGNKYNTLEDAKKALKRFELNENKQSKVIARENKINAYNALKKVYLDYLFDYREDTEKKISDALDDLVNDIDKLDKKIEDINEKLKK